MGNRHLASSNAKFFAMAINLFIVTYHLLLWQIQYRSRQQLVLQQREHCNSSSITITKFHFICLAWIRINIIVDGGYSPLPAFVTRTTLRGMIAGDIEPGEQSLAEFIAMMDSAQPAPAANVQFAPEQSGGQVKKLVAY